MGNALAMPQRRRLARKGQDRRGETSIRAAWGRPGQASRSSQIRGPASGWITGSTSACEEEDEAQASDGHVGFFDITKAIKRVRRTGSSALFITSARLGRQSTTIFGIWSQRVMKDLQAGRQLYSGANNGAQSEQCPMGPTARLAIELPEQCPCNRNLCGPKAPWRVAMHDAVTMPLRVASSAVAAAQAPLRIAVTNPRYESSS